MRSVDRPFRLVPPPVPTNAFVRPHLHERMLERFRRRVVVVTAGAGFGKTTLLVQAVHENRIDARGLDVWLGCEPADGSASTILGALLASLRADAAGTDRAPMPETQPTVHDVCAAVWAHAPEAVCLVLDDVHVIEAGSPGAQAIADLVERLPANGHLVLAGRRPPDLAVARLVVQGLADELREDDLRFDATDVARLTSAHGIDASAVGDVGGWPALVELRASANSEADTRFVGEEVLGGWTVEQRRDLAMISAVRGGRLDVLEEVCGHPIDVALIRRVPLVAVDAAGDVRPHALWEQLLAGELTADEVTDARRRAAATLTALGDPAAAFELLAAADQWDTALAALFDACNDQRSPPWADVMERWHRLVPTHLLAEPEVAYVRGMVLRGQDPWAPGALDHLHEAYLGFRQRGDLIREVTAMVRASYVALVRGDIVWAVEAAERLDVFRAAGLPIDQLRATNLAMQHLIEARPLDALVEAESLVDLEPRLRHFRGFFEAWAHLALGDARAAIVPADASASAAAPVAPAAGTGLAAMLPRAVRLAAGELPDLAGVPDELGPRFNTAERVPDLAVLAIALAHTGDATRAADAVARIDALVPGSPVRPLADGFAAVAAAAVAVAAGDEQAAAAELARRLGARLDPVGAGTAVRWYPALPYVLHPGARVWLDRAVPGATASEVLDACRGLLAAREGRPTGRIALVDQPERLVAALGLRWAVELIVRTTSDAVAGAAVRELALHWPEPTRVALRALHRTGTSVAGRATKLAASIPIPPGEHVELSFLGPSQLRRDDRAVDDANWRRSRVRQLLACLAIHRSMHRERLADLLWPDATAKAASANLRMTLSYVQALLEPERERGDAPWFIRQDGGVLTLRASTELTVDLWEFDDGVERAQAFRSAARPSDELATLLATTGRWRGEPFVELGDAEWLSDERERLRVRFTRAAERAGALLTAAGRAGEAGLLADRGLLADPWHEGLHRVAITARRTAGDDAGARLSIDRCRRALAELGVEPSAATRAVIAG